VGVVYAARIAQLVLAKGLPEETLLNVNIPDRPRSGIKGVRVTCLSRRRFHNPIIEKVDPHGRKYYWIAGKRVSWSRNKDADHEAIEEGYVSITPIHLDSTHYGVLDQFRSWEPMIKHGHIKSSALRSALGSMEESGT
jgi:5'-nucleotidase